MTIPIASSIHKEHERLCLTFTFGNFMKQHNPPSRPRVWCPLAAAHNLGREVYHRIEGVGVGRISYVDNGEWRLKIKAFAGGGVLGVGVSYGAEMESFRREGRKWKKRNVPLLTIELFYHAIGTGGVWHAVSNPKAHLDIKGDGKEEDDNEIEVAIRGTRVDHPHWPGQTLDLRGIEAKGRATLPGGQTLSTGRVIHGEVRGQFIPD